MELVADAAGRAGSRPAEKPVAQDHGEFILLSSGRKGTFLALSALESHPQVRTYEQVLEMPTYRPEDSGREVLEHLFGSPPDGIRATVLPVAWSSARNRYSGFWDDLRARGVSLIYLQRRNMLRWYVSMFLAAETGVWIASVPPQSAPPPVQVDPAYCRKRILLDRLEQRQAKRFFAGHRTLDLWYEDLIYDFDQQMEKVQHFLGVAPHRLRPSCVKQQTRPLAQAIANYEQLKAVWSGTRWEAYLDDCAEPGVSVGP